MITSKFVKGSGGKYRIVYYDSLGYLQLNCYAKDLQNKDTYVIGNYQELTANQLLEEIEHERY
jgi:hypothetical protein